LLEEEDLEEIYRVEKNQGHGEMANSEPLKVIAYNEANKPNLATEPLKNHERKSWRNRNFL